MIGDIFLVLAGLVALVVGGEYLVRGATALSLRLGLPPLIVGLTVFGVLFALNSALHSYLIVSYASEDGVSLDVGFYYMANAAGRLVGTLLSGLSYQIGGLALCLTTAGAMALALGIGLQNFPEGLAVSMPLRREGLTRSKAFLYGQLSAIVEPIFAFIGAFLVQFARPILPYALAYAAGAMIFVVAEEVIPESQSSGNGDLATMGLLFGFAVMMVLDVALG